MAGVTAPTSGVAAGGLSCDWDVTGPQGSCPSLSSGQGALINGPQTLKGGKRRMWRWDVCPGAEMSNSPQEGGGGEDEDVPWRDDAGQRARGGARPAPTAALLCDQSTEPHGEQVGSRPASPPGLWWRARPLLPWGRGRGSVPTITILVAPMDCGLVTLGVTSALEWPSQSSRWGSRRAKDRPETPWGRRVAELVFWGRETSVGAGPQHQAR